MDDVEAERARLERELATARARIDATRHRASDLRSALHAEVVASQEQLAMMERQHQEALTMVRETAKSEATRIMEHARRGSAVRDDD